MGCNRMKANRWSWYATGAVVGLVGGFLLPLFGSLFLLLEGRLARDYPFLESFAYALTLMLFPLLAFGLYCLNVAVERAVPVEYCCSRRQMPKAAPRGRDRQTARRRGGSVFTNFL
jgi:hypothetical protein